MIRSRTNRPVSLRVRRSRWYLFAQYLKTELEELGLKDISLDENGYLFATLPSNVDHEVPVVGFIAHMDTSPDMSGENVKPRIVEKYDGKGECETAYR